MQHFAHVIYADILSKNLNIFVKQDGNKKHQKIKHTCLQ